MKSQRTLRVLLSCLLSTAVAHAQDDFEGAYVYRVDGDLQIQRATDPAPEPGEINMPILAGDRVWTGVETLAEIRFASTTVISLGAETKIDFMSLGAEPTLRLWSGSVVVVPAVGAIGIRIDTPSGSFYPQSSGEFRLDVIDGEQTELTVTDGVAELASEHGSVLVHAGERSVVASGTAPESPVAFDTRAEDSLDTYPRARTRAAPLAAAAPVEDVPEEVHHYVEELSEHGTWRASDEYGSVWYPSVASSWAPYRDGRWSYTTYGHTWISHEPWGWAPYHYGRWGYDPTGWYWIPGRRFGPAWVSFAVGPTWVAWSPLGFHGGAVFGYGSYYYGNRYRNSHYYRNGRYGYRPGHAYRGGKAVPRHVYDQGAGWHFQEKSHVGKRNRGRLRAEDVRATAAHATVRNNVSSLGRDYNVRSRSLASASSAKRRATASPFDERRVGRRAIDRRAGTLRSPETAPVRNGRASNRARASRRGTDRGAVDSSERRATDSNTRAATIPRATTRRSPTLGLSSGRSRTSSDSNASRSSRPRRRSSTSAGASATQAAPRRPSTRRGNESSTSSATPARTRRYDGSAATTRRAPTGSATRGQDRRQGVSRRTPGVRPAPRTSPIPRATRRPSRRAPSPSSLGSPRAGSGSRTMRATPSRSRSGSSGSRRVGAPSRRPSSPSSAPARSGSGRARSSRNRNRN